MKSSYAETSSSTHISIIICHDPWEHRVLHQVIVGASSKCVQVHQVLEVINLTSLATIKYLYIRQ